MAHSLVQIVETLTLAFDNPVSLNSPSGEIFALTSELEGWEPDEDWRWRMENMRIPMGELSSPQLNQAGEVCKDWSDKATLYTNGDHRYVGVYIMHEGAPVACLAVSEGKHALGNRDIALVQHFADGFSTESLFLQSISAVDGEAKALLDVLDGDENAAAELLPEGPWNLALVRNVARSDVMYREQLMYGLRQSKARLVCVQRENAVFVLIPCSDEHAFAELEGRLGLRTHYQVALSARLGSAADVPRGLAQCEAMLDCMPAAEPGIVSFEEHAPELICELVHQRMPEMAALRHPALVQLEAYDALNGTELCETLNVYLAEERSLKRAAERLFIHRNSLAYRIERICEICGVDLADERTRRHLALSYILQ